MNTFVITENTMVGPFEDVMVVHGSSYLENIGVIFAAATTAINPNGDRVPLIILHDEFGLDDGVFVEFVLFHELGHVKLGHLDRLGENSNYCMSDSTYCDPEMEHEADLFAARRMIDVYGMEIVSVFSKMYQSFEKDKDMIRIEEGMSDEEFQGVLLTGDIIKRAIDCMKECQ